MRIIVTGGAGFIGSAVIRQLIRSTDHVVLNIDKLTYAGNLRSLEDIESSDRYEFAHLDICDTPLLRETFDRFQPDAIMHLAAESHVDRSIDSPSEFIQTNIVGTYNLLDISRKYWKSMPETRGTGFRFLHVSTDEVFGDLEPDQYFSEASPYQPSSPYSASKASSDHLVRAWSRTYGLPVLITNCSNNYGPYQFPEKLIPLMILNAIEGKSLPVYGDGSNIRDWLYVEDHAKGLTMVLENGNPGQTYVMGGRNENNNLDIVKMICDILEELKPDRPANISHYRDLIEFVADRPGHDQRYAMDIGNISADLGWQPAESLRSGLQKTVQWYLEHPRWWQAVLDGTYQRERLGLYEAS